MSIYFAISPQTVNIFIACFPLLNLYTIVISDCKAPSRVTVRLATN